MFKIKINLLSILFSILWWNKPKIPTINITFLILFIGVAFSDELHGVSPIDIIIPFNSFDHVFLWILSIVIKVFRTIGLFWLIFNIFCVFFAPFEESGLLWCSLILIHINSTTGIFKLVNIFHGLLLHILCHLNINILF